MKYVYICNDCDFMENKYRRLNIQSVNKIDISFNYLEK